MTRDAHRSIVLALLGTLLGAGVAQAQLSPGPLASPHAALDAQTQCFQCHARGGGGAMDDRCLACHTEIATMRKNNRGFHARDGKGACAKCHPDHAGRDFEMVKWDEGSPKAFRHDRAGFTLEGKHAGLECVSCHQTKFQRPPIAPLIRRKDHAKSWLGMEPACASCHTDIHRGQLGLQCQSCHDVKAWKPAPGFDHAKSDYPLTGKHATVACEKCHQAPGMAVAHGTSGAPQMQWKPLPHADCASCHKDPHAGRFAGACASCHHTESFATMNASGFNHDVTRYPLRGKHATLKCATCHDPKTGWGKKPPFAGCGSCHRDAHAGQATIGGQSADCSNCHKVDGWVPGSFSIALHARTALPLDGKHAAVKCIACHTRGGPETVASLGSSKVVMRPRSDRCARCHADAHGGQLASRADGGACEACHVVAGWKPSTFGVTQHATLVFVLAGKHASTACAACHGAVRPGLPPPASASALGPGTFAFKLKERECAQCHQDPHQGRFTSGPHARDQGCLSCHDVNGFHPSRMDLASHAKSGFPLEGAHRAVPCQACHAELKAQPPAGSLLLAAHDPRPLRFTEKGKRCADCHTTPHGTQFASRKDQGACETCHGLDQFAKAERFDHDRASSFKIEGAHAKAPCASCHPRAADTDGVVRVIYKPVSGKCESCHVSGGSARPLPKTLMGHPVPNHPFVDPTPIIAEERHVPSAP